MISPFEDETIAVVQGIDVLPENRDLFYWDSLQRFYYTRECRTWFKTHNNIGLSFTSCALRRMVWEENPFGRIEMCEDKVFQKRIMEKRYKIFFQKRAMDYHSHMYTVKSLAKRCENEGMGWEDRRAKLFLN